MRKQTKIAAVVSAAALLALGASMTSFAASKGTWMMVDGEWYCYDKNGDAYTNVFCSSNGKEYYVGDDGQLVRVSDVDVAEAVFRQLAHLGGAGVCHHTLAFQENLVQRAGALGTDGRHTANDAVVFYQFDHDLAREDALRTVGDVDIRLLPRLLREA